MYVGIKSSYTIPVWVFYYITAMGILNRLDRCNGITILVRRLLSLYTLRTVWLMDENISRTSDVAFMILTSR